MLEQRMAGGMSAKKKKKECNSKFNLLLYRQSSSHWTQPLENNTVNFWHTKKILNSDLNAPEGEQQKCRNYSGVSPRKQRSII